MADVNDLVASGDLSPFPGAPFDEFVVDAAVSELRREAKWHIAGSRTETVVVESDGGCNIILPTLHLTGVTAVRDVTSIDGDPVPVLTWRTNATARFRAGIVNRPAGWPCGVLEFDIVHGYDKCPQELLPILAAACRQIGADARTVQGQAAGPFNVTFRDPASQDVDPAVARHTLPSRP